MKKWCSRCGSSVHPSRSKNHPDQDQADEKVIFDLVCPRCETSLGQISENALASVW